MSGIQGSRGIVSAFRNLVLQKAKELAHKFKDSWQNITKFIRSPEQVATALGEKKIIVGQNPPPQVTTEKGSIVFNKGKYIYLAEAPPIKNLVISGGGAKGVILPGVFKAFETKEPNKNSLMEQLDNVAGSSVGALTAGFIAAGMRSDDIIKALEDQNFKALLGISKKPMHKDGVPLTNFIRESLKTSVSTHLESMFGKDLENITEANIEAYVEDKLEGSEEDQEVVSSHLSQLLDALKEEPPRITFAMLHSLHVLEPETFKDLTVTATNNEYGKTFYFDANSTPNLDISLAIRASASFPVILLPVELDKASLSPGYEAFFKGRDSLTFSDGGYLDNIPVLAMEGKQERHAINRGIEGQNLQTIVLIFDETKTKVGRQTPFLEVKTKKHALYKSNSLKERLIRDIVGKFFGGIKTSERNTLKKEAGLERIRQDYTQRHVPLAVSIKASDFDKAQALQKTYVDKGYEQGMAYLEMHKDELVAHEFDSLDALLESTGDVIGEDQLQEFEQKIRELKS